MNAEAKRAIRTIHACIARGRYQVTAHFARRLKERGMIWSDVLAVVDEPTEVRNSGKDVWDRPRWIVAGKTADGLSIEMVCVIDVDEQGEMILLITIFWPDR